MRQVTVIRLLILALWVSAALVGYFWQDILYLFDTPIVGCITDTECGCIYDCLS